MLSSIGNGMPANRLPHPGNNFVGFCFHSVRNSWSSLNVLMKALALDFADFISENIENESVTHL